MTKIKVTPKMVTKLKKNEVFVFGSNLNGNHIGGAAKLALDKFGAMNGTPIGLQGNSCAIPTLDAKMNKIGLDALKVYVNEFTQFVSDNQDLHFYLTDIGCGIAGFTHAEIAPIFKDLFNSGLKNISFPQQFIDILSVVKRGYKVTDAKMQCRGYQYELGKVYTHNGKIEPCSSGFHYCEQANDCFNYYNFNSENRVFEVVDYGKSVKDGDKTCTSSIEFVRELSWQEVLVLVNTGNCNTGRSNSGDSNSGNRNSGDWNSGNRNSGNRNSGNSNSGNRNSGDSNSGNSNSGDSNSGNSNSGDSNSGDSNSGYRNSGYWNSGNRNSGDSNSGYRNDGAFCSDNNPKIRLFDKETNILVKDWEQSKAVRIMSEYLNPNIWVYSSEMTDKEKKDFPTHETTGGYLKSISMHEAWKNMWGNLSEENKQVFTSLPNFDKDKFKVITGITV